MTQLTTRQERVTKQDLRCFQYHTGAEVTPVAADEVCPLLFRDVGLDAMARFLRGDLRRLCGPLSPITYLRTSDYKEPYTDFGGIGRILLIQPLRVRPWRSGLEDVYIAANDIRIDPQTMAFVPASVPLAMAESQFRSVQTCRGLAEAFGPKDYAGEIAATLESLDQLQRTHAATERRAAPLRRQFQSMDQSKRDDARNWMNRVALDESDLCTAWHHLTSERREHIQSVLSEYPETT